MSQHEAIVFLQNAWKRHPFSPGQLASRREEDWGLVPEWYKDVVDWPRRHWLWATSRSRTGENLAKIWPDLFDCEDSGRIWLDDSTPKTAIGESSMKLPPDPDYIRRVIDYVQPRYIVTCGVQASESVGKLWVGRMIQMPHPAYRVLTNHLFKVVRDMIELDSFYRARVFQGVREVGVHDPDLKTADYPFGCPTVFYKT